MVTTKQKIYNLFSNHTESKTSYEMWCSLLADNPEITLKNARKSINESVHLDYLKQTVNGKHYTYSLGHRKPRSFKIVPKKENALSLKWI